MLGLSLATPHLLANHHLPTTVRTWCKNISPASCSIFIRDCILSMLRAAYAQWLTPHLLSFVTSHFCAFNNSKTLAFTTRGLQDAQLPASCFRCLGSSVTPLKLLYLGALPICRSNVPAPFPMSTFWTFIAPVLNGVVIAKGFTLPPCLFLAA